jgi:mono/diheme cytochrome c family protein
MARSRTLHEYNISALNKWFAALSILMVAVVIGMVMDDYQRSWKQHQREFMRMEWQQLEAAKNAAQEDLNQDRLQEAEEKVAEAQLALAEHQGALDRLDADLKRAKGDFYVKDQRARFYKAEYDVVKYDLYAADRSHDEQKAEKIQAKLAEMEAELERLRLEKESAAARQAEVAGQIVEIRKDVAKAQDRVDRYVGEIQKMDQKLAASGPNLFNTLRNAPMMEFVAPSLKINQIRPAGLSYSVNYGVTERVDRCTTCHLGMELRNWESAEEPYTTHPRLDVFVGSSSPHPSSDFGCTECHLGRPRGVEFSRAAHTPASEEQAREWEKKYGWKDMHHWMQPMSDSTMYESGCFKCHAGERLIPEAPRYNAGREYVEYYGCYGCHKINGYDDLPKRGPNLSRVAEKFTPEFAYRWINEPKAIRPHTTMPRIFHLDNVVGGVEGDDTYWARRTQADVNSIVAYLYEKSESRGFGGQGVPSGDAANGEALFDAVGCRGCHLVGAEEDSLDVLGVSPLQFGPNLEGIASKTSAEFIDAWIQDPRAYDPTTSMPDLRLTSGEAADITAYLMQLTAPDDARYQKSPSDPAMVDNALMDYLSNTQPVAAAKAQLEALDLHEREVLLGEKVIAKQGCYGCHVIPGFEATLPIGTELSEEGSKQLHKFDFGNVHEIEHSVTGWIRHKLLQPRSFDMGMYQKPLEKLRMPDFGMTEEQAQLVLGNVMSWQKHTVPDERQKMLTSREELVAAGERLIAQRNCRGCHPVEGLGGAIAQYIEDSGYAPPNLYNEGAKIQPEWLARFLHAPTPIRPWLKVRMPSFQFSEEDIGTIANYFMAASKVQDKPYPQADLGSYPKAAPGSDYFTLYKCQQCHPTGPATGEVSASELAPNLTMAKDRLRPDWIVAWLTDPQSQMPGTKMPSFFYEDGEYFFDEAPDHIEAIRDHLMTLD